MWFALFNKNNKKRIPTYRAMLLSSMTFYFLSFNQFSETINGMTIVNSQALVKIIKRGYIIRKNRFFKPNNFFTMFFPSSIVHSNYMAGWFCTDGLNNCIKFSTKIQEIRYIIAGYILAGLTQKNLSKHSQVRMALHYLQEFFSQTIF